MPFLSDRANGFIPKLTSYYSLKFAGLLHIIKSFKERTLILSGSEGREDVIFSVEELAQYLRVKEQRIYEKAHKGGIPYYKVGKYLRFRKPIIDGWLRKMERGKSVKTAKPVRRLLEDAA
jgi:excisionase family DNA binding protein